MSWSEPFYGVQHLDGVRKGFQVTVEDRDTWSEAWVVEGLRTLAESSHDTPEQARTWAEGQARLLRLMP